MRALPVVRWMAKPFRVHIPSEGKRERWGSTAAPGWVRFTVGLTIADLAVYLDYGHWHLLPALQRPTFQIAGLLLHIAVAIWNRWTSKYLGVAFADNALRPALIRSGPFSYARHPLYAGAILQKIAVALVFGSVLGWLLVVPWCVLLLRQVRLEEIHLRKLFGEEYEEYAQQTAKLAPGIF